METLKNKEFQVTVILSIAFVVAILGLIIYG